MADQAPKEAVAEHRAITGRAGIVALGTLSSRLLGAGRDAVIAASFALSATDAWVVAWTIPNTLRRVFAEGATSAAFVPIFTELAERDGKDRARAYLAAYMGTLLLVLIGVSLVGVGTARTWAELYAHGYVNDAEKFAATVQLTQLLFPYILFAGMAALFTGALNAMTRFLVPAFSPALLNISIIAAPVLFAPVAISLGLAPIAGLAIAALIGGVLQLLVMAPQLKRAGMLPRPTFGFADPAVRRSMSLMVPVVLGTGVYQINVLLSRLFASFLPNGAQSFLYYGQRLVEIPQGMFAVAIASAALPSLARLRSRDEHGPAREALAYSVRLSLFIAFPASAALAALAVPTVTMVFGRGAFGASQVQQTADALIWMAAGVWAVAAIHPITRMYYAYNDTRTPVLCGALNLLVFASLSVLWMGDHGHVGIAMATSAGSVAQLLALCALLGRRVGGMPWGPVAAAGLRSLAGALVMGAILSDVARVGAWELGGNDPGNLLLYLGLIVFGLGCYGATTYLLRSDELTEIRDTLRRRTQSP